MPDEFPPPRHGTFRLNVVITCLRCVKTVLRLVILYYTIVIQQVKIFYNFP